MGETRIRTEEQTSEFTLPPEIQKIVNERGFYLHEWVSPIEYLLTTQRDFLRFAKKYSSHMVSGLLSIIISTLLFLNFINIILVLYSIVVGVAVIPVILYNIKLSRYFLKASKIVCTNKCILSKGEVFSARSEKIKGIGDYFNEPIFKKSELIGERKTILKTIYSEWLFMSGERVYPKIVLLIGTFVIYGIWTALILPMSMFFIVFLSIITLFTHYTETHINSLFSSVDKSSSTLQSQKQKLLDSLESGTGFHDFQKVFSLLSRSADSSIKNSGKLQKLLENSKFHDIFDFDVYNSWIRKQVREPLEQIFELIEKNIHILTDTKKKLVLQIAETFDKNLQALLELQLVRIDEQIVGFEKNRPILEEYLARLNK